jgi:proteasome accessory factor C
MAARRGPRPLNDRIRRLLVILPWLMERRRATLAEMSERFQMSEKDLIVDLEQAATCGLPPFVDEFVDLFIDDDGVVEVGVPRFFTRPLRLTAPEGFALLVAGRAALAMPGVEPDGPLARALAKLEVVLGDDGMVLDLGQPPAAADLASAAASAAVVRISYWSASSDETTERLITPQAVFADRGRWYVVADDDRSGEERTFRIDRIADWHLTGDTSAARVVTAPTGHAWFDELTDLELITLRLRPGGRWAAEQYPVRSAVADGDDLVVQMAVASEVWLRTLLLQLGPAADVIEPATRVGLARDTAQALLQTRYAVSS